MADHTVPQGWVCGSTPFSSPFFPPFSGGHFLDTLCDRGSVMARVIRCGDRSTGAMRSPAHPRCRCGPGMQQDAQPWRWSPGAESPLSPLLWQRFSFPSSPPREGAAGLQGSYGLKDLNASNLPFGGRLECISPPNSHQKQRTSLISFRALLSSFPRLISLKVKHLQMFPGGPQCRGSLPRRTSVSLACAGSSR